MAIEGVRNLRDAEARDFIRDNFWEECFPEGVDRFDITARWCSLIAPGTGCCTRPKGHGGMHVNIPQYSGMRLEEVSRIATWFGQN